jgi:hypothetical protein
MADLPFLCNRVFRKKVNVNQRISNSQTQYLPPPDVLVRAG